MAFRHRYLKKHLRKGGTAMKKTRIYKTVTLIVIWLLCCSLAVDGAASEENEILRYACCYQVFEAFGMDQLKLFTKATEVGVGLYIASSNSSKQRIINNLSDIASTTRPIDRKYIERGFVQIPFCKDPMAIIVNEANPVKSLTVSQLREIFGGGVANWKEAGGPDHPIVSVVADRDTGAYENFKGLVMGNREIAYDMMSYKSTDVINIVSHIPWSISFIAQGDVFNKKGIKPIRINNMLPKDAGYPYHQTFYYITKGEPFGATKAFIDFTMSKNGLDIMKKNGMKPIK